jgi:hypothetical protein
MFQFLMKALIGETGHQFREHIGSRGISTTIEVLASEKKQGLGDMTFASPGVAGNDQALLPCDKVQRCNLQDLDFVYPRLEAKVEVRQKLSLGKTGFLDSSLNPSFGPSLGLDGQEPFHQFHWGKSLLGSPGQFLVKDFLDSQKLQGLQMLSDSGQGLLRHRRLPFCIVRCIVPGAAG